MAAGLARQIGPGGPVKLGPESIGIFSAFSAFSAVVPSFASCDQTAKNSVSAEEADDAQPGLFRLAPLCSAVVKNDIGSAAERFRHRVISAAEAAVKARGSVGPLELF